MRCLQKREKNKIRKLLLALFVSAKGISLKGGHRLELGGKNCMLAGDVERGEEKS